VQLANFNPRRSEPSESDWAELREAQLAALGMRKTAMAVAIDVGEAADIHPKNKRDVGLRLALAARSVAYNERGVAHSGPVFRSMSRAGGSLILRFAHTDGGLQAAGGVPLRGFAVAGKRIAGSTGPMPPFGAERSSSPVRRCPILSRSATPGRTIPTATW